MATRGPEEIRHEIEETREQLGETVEALAEKTDVKSQARAKVDEAKVRFHRKADEAKAKLVEVAPEQAKGAASGAAATASRRPLPFAAAGAFAAGLMAGVLVSRARR
jgi:ElaB/YqjD/DUF883 family membrane-anchored ribosome-binding protein